MSEKMSTQSGGSEGQQKSSVGIAIGVVVVVLVTAGLVYAFVGNSDDANEEASTTSSTNTTATGEGTNESDTTNSEAVVNETTDGDEVIDEGTRASDKDTAGEVSFDVSGVNFEFSQSEIIVTKGDTVTVNFTSEGGSHDWVVDEFDAATEIVSSGDSSSVTFVADQAGTFEYYCSVGNHRALGMVGNLIVE